MPALFRWHRSLPILATLILANLFLFTNIQETNSSPVISQVQTSGIGNLSKQDFIKLFNPDTSPFNLKGHRLIKRSKTSTTDTSLKSFTTDTLIPAGGYFTWASSDDGFADSINADTATSQTLADDNGIALRQGSANEGLIIDSVAWGEADNGLAEGTIFASNPAPGQVITRRNNLDTNNNATDFYLAEPGDSTTNSTTPQTSASSGSANVSYFNQIFINELVSDPEAEDTEWIELYNANSQAFSLDNWTLEDGSGTKTTLSGSISKYLVIASPKGNLNNTGDNLLLKDPSGQIIDELSYGDWLDLASNAPVAKKPNSLALKTDGLTTNNYLNDWAITTTPTKNSSNLITLIDNDQSSSSSISNLKDCPLIINEVLPDPLGADLLGEFIEIYNPGTTAIDLIGWSITAPNQLPFIFGLQTLPALHYLSLPRSLTRLSLNNSGDTLELYQPQAEKACFKFKYTQSSPGASFGYNNDTLTWSKPRQLWSRQATPGGKNSSLNINQAPKAIINHSLDGQILSFDASDSTDPNADQLLFQWSFGDGQSSTELAGTHHYTQTGNYQLNLSVSDGYLASQSKVNLTIGQPSSEPTNTITPKPTTATSSPKPKTATKASSSTKSSTASTKKTTSNSSSSSSSSQLQLTGTVLDRPGTFSSLYFFLLPDNETQAWQIYRQKGQLPSLQPGQRLTASGRRSSIANIKRLLISEVSDLQLQDLSEPASPTAITLEQASGHLGELVTVKGQVTDRAKDNFYLDDGRAELLVRLKAGTGLTANQFNPSTTYTVSGLLVMGASAMELWPRNLADTDLNQNSQASELTSTSLPLENSESKQQTELLAHLLIGLGVLLVIISIVIFKKSQNKG